MDVGSNRLDQAHQQPNPERGLANRRLIHLIVLIVIVVLLASAAFVISAWVPLWPRPVRRGLTEGLLRAVLVGYVGLFLVLRCRDTGHGVTSLPVAPRAASAAGPARAVLLGVSCLLSLVSLELGSAGWRAWMHRYPKLPESFPKAPDDTFRIVVLGGSSALGEPYRPWMLGRADRRLAAGRGHAGAPIRVRDPGVAGRLARGAASQAGRNQAAPGHGDHLLRPQRVHRALRGRARRVAG